MAETVEFFYDIVSPFSYLASTRIEAIAADCDATVVFRPFFLGGLMKAVGNQPPATLPARGRYLFTDLRRWAAFYGVPFRLPSPFPAPTLLVMRALTALPAGELVPATHRAFAAHWGEGRDISDPALLTELLGADAVARASEPAVKQALLDATAEAERRGAFGAPSFFVGEELYFGNDRLPFLEQRLRGKRLA
jgi:2-hydroxychromene-2-carboxylate isomerase